MTTALVIIDMQAEMAARITAGRQHSDPAALDRVAAVLALFRARGLPVVHVLHDEPGTPFARDLPTSAPLACAAPLEGEPRIYKSGSSGFAGTGLDAMLRRMGVTRIVAVGAVAGFCVTSTVRAAADLGFAVLLPGDALLGFDIPAHDGGRIDAETVMRVTLSLLAGDFARLTTLEELPALL